MLSFSCGVINTQLDTSMTVRPQPRHISSKSVEQTATQGESGRWEFEWSLMFRQNRRHASLFAVNVSLPVYRAD